MKRNSMADVFVQARAHAESSATGLQERNRLWWEQLPMTYVDWDNAARGVSTAQQFAHLETQFLEGNPWLKRFVFAAFKNQRVLEIGCGSGVASCLFANHGANVTAIDLTDCAVRTTRANAAAQGLELEVEAMDAEKLRFDAGSFDYVFSWGVLHHSANTNAAFTEAARVLRPGGGGIIMVYHKSSLRYHVRGLQWLIFKAKLFRGHNLETVQRFFTDGFYHRHFTSAELAAALSEAGLEVERVEVSHMNTRMLPCLPKAWVDVLKRKWGWLLIAQLSKPGANRRHAGSA
jgi:2-polyprenyl-3-methyl-5-hydroxy-6-metoxy-1,4-benzoquinol methylase